MPVASISTVHIIRTTENFIPSVLGNIYFAGVGHAAFSFTEGLAAGAMLTMIAQTMLPEAYFKGGEIIGFSTLLGFLAAIFFKTLE